MAVIDCVVLQNHHRLHLHWQQVQAERLHHLGMVLMIAECHCSGGHPEHEQQMTLSLTLRLVAGVAARYGSAQKRIAAGCGLVRARRDA